MQSDENEKHQLAFQILRAVDDLAEQAVETNTELAFELYSNVDTYIILMRLIEDGCPYGGNESTRFEAGPKFTARSIALEVLHNLGFVEGVGSFVAQECKNQVVELFK